MTAFTRWMWHKTYQTFCCLTSRLYLESECDDLSSDRCNLPITFELLSSEYDVSRSHLNHRPTSTTEMTAFTRWMWHKTYQAFSCFASRLYFEPECDDLSSVLWYLQISFEPPMSITETTAFKWMMWHIIYQTCSCFPSRDCIKSQNAMVLVQTYGISRSHLNHRPPNVNITRHRSCSKSHEYLDQAWRDYVPGMRCCQYLGLHNKCRWLGEEPSATVKSSMCSAKLLRQQCRSVLIDV